ncbi:MAG TPA: (Fe-S)-binding protein [Polyangia bacterium]|jgi:Fe-S oxidoreductase
MTLRQHRRALDYCTYCPKLCRCACPVAGVDAHESHIPQQKMLALGLMDHGHADWAADRAEALWACAGCGACQSWCRHGIDVAAALRAGRAAALARGAGHPRLAELDFTFRERLPRLRAAARANLPHERFAREAQVAFYPGCEAIANAPGEVLRTLGVLDRLGAEYLRLFDGDELCAGYPLWASGHEDAFRTYAARVARALGRYRKVVCGCPACVYLLRHVYHTVGVAVPCEVLELSEFLEGFVGRIPQTRQLGPVFFHDPCHLGRLLGDFEGPRRLLRPLTAAVHEFSRNRAAAACCGGGGLLPRTFPATAEAMAEARLGEVLEAGVPVVATACPTCKRRLGAAAARLAARGTAAVEVVDLVDVLDRTIDVEP